MGTRSTIKFKDNNTTVLSLYNQYDGYLSGVGEELAVWLSRFTIVDEYNYSTPKRSANGIGCLAAQYVAEHKNGIGNMYCTSEDDIQEYNYVVIVKYGNILMECDGFDEFEVLSNYNGAKQMTPKEVLMLIEQLGEIEV